MKLLGSSAYEVDPTTGIRVTLTAGKDVAFPGADRFKVDGDGELTVTMNDAPLAVVARGKWTLAFYVFALDRTAATAV